MEPAPGRLVRRVALGTEAIYRVIEASRDTVEVEVVRAPGLPAGRRLKLAARDVRAMQVLESGPPASPPARSETG
ncbi:MAG: hypothetical protein JO206_15445 [Solirubrobacterales bacterium]|nr:hypothetical protein [Solirubrobacterales bacterium]MBV9474358.1 hypothetical protein [Solirubrobacterales bacterium]MBV9839329.1 hypothetical protein [Solirubrobacterales bacterium]